MSYNNHKKNQNIYQEMVKQLRLSCMEKNARLHNYRSPSPDEYRRVMMILQPIMKDTYFELSICHDCLAIEYKKEV